MGKNMKAYMVIVVVAVLAAAVWMYLGKPSVVSQTPGNEEGEQEEENVVGTKTPVLSYTAAVKLYGDKRIQFDENCVVSPTNPSFKVGTKIMLDNRSSKKRSISLDSQYYSIGAYDFRVVTLNTSSKLPHEVLIDCDNGQQNGRINLQQ